MPQNSQRDVYTVARLNREARMILEAGIPPVWVEGEISNLSCPTSGHWYFTLKDRDAQVRCAMFRMRNLQVGFRPRDGQLLTVRGRVGLYEPRGDYQLIVEQMEDAGEGALRREFERLKAKLAAEGLFDAALKRPLPSMPRRIAVITSPTGAAVRDILHVLARRFPPAAVLVYPVPVQGAAAVPAILAALEEAGTGQQCDVVILARGGGSIEDLWSFNDERVARAIRGCRLPVVTGIGHETDFTIADFAADLRAPTPSGAAELAVPDRASLLEGLGTTRQRLQLAMQRQLLHTEQRYQALTARLQRAHPGAQLTQQVQRLDELELRLGAGWSNYLRQLTQQLTLVQRALHAISPLATLERGYAIVANAAGEAVTDAAQLAAGESLVLRFARGGADAIVTKIRTAAAE